MIRTMLDDATRDELRALRRTDLPAKVRDRIEMVALSDAGWSAPRIAAHLGCHPQTVRDLLRSFNARGTAALRPFRSGPAPDAERSDRVVAALRELLAERRTWTSRQLAGALAGRGIALGRGRSAATSGAWGPAIAAPPRRSSTSRTRRRPSGPGGCWTTSRPGPPPAA